jgi:hypothetical protein
VRPLLIAFTLGAVAVAIAASVAGLALGIAAQSGHWHAFRVALGPVVLLAYERSGGGTSTTFGNGLAFLAAAGGALNALGAVVMRRRS